MIFLLDANASSFPTEKMNQTFEKTVLKNLGISSSRQPLKINRGPNAELANIVEC